MKKLLLTLMCLTVMSLGAQNVVSFKLTPNGSFISEDGKGFVVVPFEGKNAHQIFQQLAVNVNALYKNPSKVMSVVDDASITIRAYDDQISYIKDFIQKFWIGGYYNLNFQIKDGKVKVQAPIIDEEMTKTVDNSRVKDFSKMVNNWYKNGELKDKFKAQVEYTENNINSLINKILESANNNSEDW